MYNQEDMQSITQSVRKRWLITNIPTVIVLAAAVVVFVYGQQNRSETLWMVTSALTLLGGGYFLFMYGVYVRPARIYRKHVGYMLNGRKRVTTGYFTSFSEDVSDRDGLECHAMMINVGERNDPEDDRLFYYDAYKDRPAMAFGTKITVESNDKMVSAITVA